MYLVPGYEIEIIIGSVVDNKQIALTVWFIVFSIVANVEQIS